jgi:hypothetical protein
VGFCGGAGGFFPDIVVLVLIGLLFKGLAGERLTLPASFFFILLFPYGSGRNSDENGLWKSGESAIPTGDRAA